MSLLSAFNNLLDQFLQDLVLTFPELTDLRTIQTLANMVRHINARLALDNFISVAGRYHEKIFAKESSFFEDINNWKADPYLQSEYAQEQDSEIFQKLGIFTTVWVDLSESNRDKIWTYFRQLLILGARACNNPGLRSLCTQIIETSKKIKL